MTRFVPFAVLTALCAAAAPAAPEPGAGWYGRYLYTYEGGETAGGSPIAVRYRLDLGRGSCLLRAEGFQTDEAIRCVAVPVGGGLAVRFRSFADGSVENMYGVAEYRPGATLLTLRRLRGRLLTRWAGYSLPDGKVRPEGIYFRR